MNEFENYCEKLGDKGINTFSRKVPLPTKKTSYMVQDAPKREKLL